MHSSPRPLGLDYDRLLDIPSGGRFPVLCTRSAVDRLVGRRIAVTSLAIPISVLGMEQHGLLHVRCLPTDLAGERRMTR